MYYFYIDEAGRGPFAGPVCVGVIMQQVNKKVSVFDCSESNLPKPLKFSLSCEDSKILSQEERDELYIQLHKAPEFVGKTAMISAKNIDAHGIVRSLRTAIMHAIHALVVGGRFSQKSLLARIEQQQGNVLLVVDGPSDFGLRKTLGVSVLPVIDGDAKLPMVSAASILAKVDRDAYMVAIDKKYPNYNFAQHKGYGTAKHRAAIEKYGMCEEHRKSYIHHIK